MRSEYLGFRLLILLEFHSWEAWIGNIVTYVYPRTARLMSPRNRDPWKSVLGTCTKSAATSGFDESSSPTLNIEKDNAAPANGPASEISTFAFWLGRIDLNYKIKQPKRTTVSFRKVKNLDAPINLTKKMSIIFSEFHCWTLTWVIAPKLPRVIFGIK